MARFLGLGNGSDGVVNLSSYTPLKYTCSGTSGTTSLTATGSFSAGQRLFIHQTRGTGVGAYEDNTVASYTTGTITLVHPLENTYTDSGDSQAQVLIVKQASSVTGSITIPAWDGNVGGVFAIACSGVFAGTVNATGKGYRGSSIRSYSRVGVGADYTWTGEGYTQGSIFHQHTANTVGGGAGEGNDGGSGGGGGGHATSGADGIEGQGNSGDGGGTVGTATLTTIYPGGGGGGGRGESSANCVADYTYYGGNGGNGGGIIVIYARNLSSSASLVANGANGESSNGGCDDGAGGGGAGAGGSILVKAVSGNVSGTITATGGSGGSGSVKGANGGAGGTGRIRIESCSLSGTTSPSASTSTGGHDYCGSLSAIL